MKKSLVYVDAENLALNELQEVFETVKQLRNSSLVVAKFYGKIDVLGEHFGLCYQAGMEYVETSTMSSSSKNLTDMKIVVDAITDVTLATEQVDSVAIFTHDCDFVPLVYKLMGLNVRVETPYLNPEFVKTTGLDVESLLRKCGYVPMFREDVLRTPQLGVMKKVGYQISPVVIDEYFAKRKSRFVRELMKTKYEGTAEALQEVANEQFSAELVIEMLGITSEKEAERVVGIFTRKMLGFSFPTEVLQEKAKELL